jgi:hypothetical protein
MAGARYHGQPHLKCRTGMPTSTGHECIALVIFFLPLASAASELRRSGVRVHFYIGSSNGTR